jgi:hypothetical protein
MTITPDLSMSFSACCPLWPQSRIFMQNKMDKTGQMVLFFIQTKKIMAAKKSRRNGSSSRRQTPPVYVLPVTLTAEQKKILKLAQTYALLDENRNPSLSPYEAWEELQDAGILNLLPALPQEEDDEEEEDGDNEENHVVYIEEHEVKPPREPIHVDFSFLAPVGKGIGEFIGLFYVNPKKIIGPNWPSST